MTNRYNKEYEQYYTYALEQFLIKTYGYSEHDAKVKVIGDIEEVKEDFENKEIIWICNLNFGGIMEIEEILTKNIQVELSRIRMLLFVIAFVLILEFLL